MGFAELGLWGRTSRPLVESVPPGWKLHRIGELVEQATTRVKVEAECQYNMTGVKWYGEGIFLRETVQGKDLSATYVCPVVPNALIYNRLFAWKGSFAVVPAEAKGQYVSNEFPQFVVNEALALPEYLYLYSMSKPVMEAVNRASAGSAAVSRNRLKEAAFLNIEIPLPPLATQRAIVERWQEARAAAEAATVEADQVERDAAREFLHGLGFRAPDEVKRRKAFAVGWRDFERWGLEWHQQRLGGLELEVGKFPAVRLGDLLELVQYGTSEKANTGNIGTPVLRINNIKNGVLDISELKHVQLPEATLRGLTLEDGDILIIRTSGSRDLVGTCAVFHENVQFTFASYLIRLRISAGKATPDYVAYFFNSPAGRAQINAVSRQIMQNNINSTELRSLKIPLPPLETQQALVAAIATARRRAAALRAEAERLRQEAAAEVEAAMLGETPIRK